VVGTGLITPINLLVYTIGFTVKKVLESWPIAGLPLLCILLGVGVYEEKQKCITQPNKKIKCNVHMASLSAVRLDANSTVYHERKIAEGKNKMIVLDAVKNIRWLE